MLKILGVTLSFIWGSTGMSAGEYGFVIMPESGSKVEQQGQCMRAHYVDRHGDLAAIRPHITIMQGAFISEGIKKAKEAVQKYAASQNPFDIEMDDKLVNGGGGNTFWDVKPLSNSWKRLDEINMRFCSDSENLPALVKHPVNLPQQVQDNVEKLAKQAEIAEEAEAQQARVILETIRKYGRNFNIPGANRPHITVVYSKQDEELASSFPFDPLASTFTAKGIYLVSLQYNGNVQEVLEFYPFSS